uniref:Uncharacterized protein n=1 Tax=Trypanosoma congolense (strain IL3000) TaxID=1068625 RepID=G0USQ9_TRYCI|nr:conserved hypothetical protein [Trypanosoma congolense IL3000]
MDNLHSVVRDVLVFHPHTIRNYGAASAVSSHGGNKRLIFMSEAAESLVTELIRVLSRGLHGEVELLTVLETLRLVPRKIMRHEDESSPLREALYRLRFSEQLIYAVRSLFTRSGAAVRSRALLRLMLNQGVLLAALELIGQWSAVELRAFYVDPRVSVLCNMEGPLWDAFLGACAPIGGVMLEQIVAGVCVGTSAVTFQMMLLPPAARRTTVGRLLPPNEGIRARNNVVLGSEGALEAERGIGVREFATPTAYLSEGQMPVRTTEMPTIPDLNYVMSTLEEAEFILITQWRELATSLSEQEALIFEMLDDQ